MMPSPLLLNEFVHHSGLFALFSIKKLFLCSDGEDTLIYHHTAVDENELAKWKSGLHKTDVNH